MATIGRLMVAIGATTDQLEKGINKAKSIAGGARGTFGKLGAVLSGPLKTGALAAGEGLLFIGSALTQVGGQAVGFAMDTNNAMRALQATTGATDEQMVALKDTSLSLFQSNLGESIGDVAQALGTVEQITGQTGDELETTARRALILRDVFDKDIKESVRAADTAVETFGGNSAQIFDMITATIQRTGDPADDLLDTVNEYSTIFAQAGFSADQMFAFLEAGLQQGARDFDQVADAVKEFNIRIIDGSDTTRNALNKLFLEVDGVGGEFAELEAELEANQAAFDATAKAVENAEGAYAASQAVVDELKGALSEARRELDELSRPNLAGMEEFDNKLFDLEQQSNRVRLALLDATPETEQFEQLQAQLDAINKEMDRVALQRDLTIEPQLRAIERAATAGRDPLMTFDEVMTAIANKKNEIAGLEGALSGATAELNNNAAAVESLKTLQDELAANIEQIQANLETAKTPADEFLSGFTDGSLTGADAMSQVIQKLKEVEDPLLQNQIGVELFGTKWEDLGPQIILALDPAIATLGDVQGATEAAFDASTNFQDQINQLGRDFLVAIEPAAQEIMPLLNEGIRLGGEFMAQAQPIFTQFGVDLRDTVGPAMLLIEDALVRISTALGITTEDASGMDVALALLAGTLNLLVTAIQGVAVLLQGVANIVEGLSSRWRTLTSDTSSFIEKLQALTELATPLGILSDVGISIPGFAGGVSNFGGGLAMVGEKGPELVNLPRGSDVIPNGGMGGVQIGNITIHANSRAEGQEAGRGFVDKLKSRGLQPAGA